MRVAVTGGTGLVGRAIVDRAIALAHQVTVLTRHPPRADAFAGQVAHRHFDLDGPAPDLGGFDAVVHAAFDHIPGRYRGGEGCDPAGFLARNLDGSVRLFGAAERADARVVFISSRAVYGPQPGPLFETTPCRPESLYGKAKLQAEQALLASKQRAAIFRATGVYGAAGPGQRHKWADLFDDFSRGKQIEPRVGSEVHGDDLAAAVGLGLSGLDGVYNVSDLLLDRRDLLTMWAEISGISGKVPGPSDANGFSAMDCSRLRAAGWSPGGTELLRAILGQMAG